MGESVRHGHCILAWPESPRILPHLFCRSSHFPFPNSCCSGSRKIKLKSNLTVTALFVSVVAATSSVHAGITRIN